MGSPRACRVLISRARGGAAGKAWPPWPSGWEGRILTLNSSPRSMVTGLGGTPRGDAAPLSQTLLWGLRASAPPGQSFAQHGSVFWPGARDTEGSDTDPTPRGSQSREGRRKLKELCRLRAGEGPDHFGPCHARISARGVGTIAAELSRAPQSWGAGR